MKFHGTLLGLRGACPLQGLETQNGIKMVLGVSKTHGIQMVFKWYSNCLYKWCLNGLQIVYMVGAWSREEPRPFKYHFKTN